MIHWGMYKSLKVNANNSKVLMLGREKGLVYEVVQMEGTFSAFHSLNTWEWNAACNTLDIEVVNP